MRKWLCTLLLLLVMAMSVQPAQALSVPPIELNNPVSLTIEYDWDGTKFDLYRVADVSKSATYTLCGQFADYGDIDWNTVLWDELAVSMADYAKDSKPLCSGMVAHQSCPFSDLKCGLYLVVGHEITVDNITYTSKPFLLILPEYADDGTWNYNVTAFPKSGSAEKQPDNPPDTPPTPPDNPPDTPNKLPQTGQLWWPVPVLLFSGIVCVLVGVIRRKGGTHE